MSTLCDNCVYQMTTPLKEKSTLDPSCPVNKPYNRESFKCAKYTCDGYIYWSFLHDDWKGCTDVVFSATCDASTCEMP